VDWFFCSSGNSYGGELRLLRRRQSDASTTDTSKTDTSSTTAIALPASSPDDKNARLVFFDANDAYRAIGVSPRA